jgi:hypothetical protein
MSNSTAIAAVTMTLQAILTNGVTSDPDLNDTTVTLLPPDKARGASTANQLNLFLYQVIRNAAWANSDIPRQLQPGETGVPPLPLNLWYLLTAFGRDNDAVQPFGHRLLGKAASVMFDHPVLSAQEIKSATAVILPTSDLGLQMERIRITLQPLSADEISKLWTGFATQYRLSMAYEVAVVLLESDLPSKTPLPVLTRGKGDSGIGSQADVLSPLPELTGVVLPNSQTSARPGDVISLVGTRLDGTEVSVVIDHVDHLLTGGPVEIAIPAGTDATAKQVRFTIPNDPVKWPAGFYAVEVWVKPPGEDARRGTKQQMLSMAPSFTITPMTTGAGNIEYTVTVSPQVRPTQKTLLLLGSLPIPADEHATPAETLTFQASAVFAGKYRVRLRVGGVDSILIDRTKTPPMFDATQEVTVT